MISGFIPFVKVSENECNRMSEVQTHILRSRSPALDHAFLDFGSERDSEKEPTADLRL